MGFVHKSFWTGKKFTIVQLLALFLLNVLSSITMGLTFALEKDNMDVTLQFGGAFAFAFEWVLLVADILFVVIPPLLSRLKSEKEKKA